jgi:phosphoglucomutase
MRHPKDTQAKISPLAGHPAAPAILVDVSGLVTAYYTKKPAPAIPEQSD